MNNGLDLQDLSWFWALRTFLTVHAFTTAPEEHTTVTGMCLTLYLIQPCNSAPALFWCWLKELPPDSCSISTKRFMSSEAGAYSVSLVHTPTAGHINPFVSLRCCRDESQSLIVVTWHDIQLYFYTAMPSLGKNMFSIPNVIEKLGRLVECAVFEGKLKRWQSWV